MVAPVKKMSAAEAREDKAEAKKLLADAPGLLKRVEQSDAMKKEAPREYPTFERSEIKIGPVLGVGGFGIVFEIKEFQLRDGSPALNTSAATAEQPANEALLEDDPHYAVNQARQHMAKHARRNDDARYAIKKLRADLTTELDKARGIVDMAVEAKFLSVLWHPNIVKMRGYATGPILSPNFFIVMDRLYETLTQQLQEWNAEYKEHSKADGLFSCCMGGGGAVDTPELKQLLLQRMTVAYDLASALQYMHQVGLVYRDIKQDNIGFDVRGDVKIFDFGLSKGISESLKAKGYGYNLTPRTGSLPYMAPEVAEGQPYDQKCDVFSFAILLWEIMSLKLAFEGFNRSDFYHRVVKGRERQNISKDWPPLTRMVLREAWAHDPQERPDMKRVAVLLRGDLNEMSDDDRITNRSRHMREKSTRSFRISKSSRDLRGPSEHPLVAGAFSTVEA